MNRSTRNAAAAGLMLVLTIVICTGAGIGLGALAGVPELAGLAGGFAGLILGFALVYARFKDI
jgi:hypothetical protein